MPDNVTFQSATPATPPAATVVSTEEVTTLNAGVVAAQQIQRILLALRTADATAIDLPGDAANGLDVDVTRSALPSGASTAANQSTIIGHLDGVEAALALLLAEATFTARVGEVQASPTANTVLARLKDLLTGIVLAAGNNNIGDVDIASIAAGDNNIGNVDLASAIPAGNNNIGDVDAIQSGTWTVQPGNTPNTTPWLVKENRAATATLSNVNDTATSTQLLASNSSRLGFRIYNDSTVNLYVKFGTTASATDYTVLLVAGDYLEERDYTGRVDGIWASDASGAARITELT